MQGNNVLEFKIQNKKIAELWDRVEIQVYASLLVICYVRVTVHEAPKEIFTTQACEVSLILLEEAWPINNIAFSPMTTIAYCFQHLWKREKVDK